MREDVRNVLNRLMVGVYVVGASALIWLLVWFGYSQWHSELSSYFAEHWHMTNQSWHWLLIGGIALIVGVGLAGLAIAVEVALVVSLLDRIVEDEFISGLCLLCSVALATIASFCVFFFYGTGMGIISSICSVGLIFALAALIKSGETYRYIREHRG